MCLHLLTCLATSAKEGVAALSLSPLLAWGICACVFLVKLTMYWNNKPRSKSCPPPTPRLRCISEWMYYTCTYVVWVKWSDALPRAHLMHNAFYLIWASSEWVASTIMAIQVLILYYDFCAPPICLFTLPRLVFSLAGVNIHVIVYTAKIAHNKTS